MNRGRLIRELRLGAPISRVELAGLTGISKPAVTRTISELIEEGLVVEAGTGKSAGGKPPTMLELNGAAGAGLACRLKLDSVSAALVGFDGEFEARAEAHFDPSGGPDVAFEAIVEVLQKVIDENPNGRPVLGLGIGVPGLVGEEGVIIVMPHLAGWKGYPLAEKLAAEFSVPVNVENESRVQALAEGWYGSGRGVENFICLESGAGVSAGIVLNGRLWRGSNSLAGEVGHTSVFGDDHRCYCGSTSCWELGASTSQLVADVRTSSISRDDERMLDPELTVADIATALDEGDEAAAIEFERHADALSKGLCNLILAYDPERIILHGDSTLFGDRLVELLKSKIRDRLALWMDYDPPLMISELGEDAGLAGAASLALRGIWGLEEVQVKGGA